MAMSAMPGRTEVLAQRAGDDVARLALSPAATASAARSEASANFGDGAGHLQQRPHPKIGQGRGQVRAASLARRKITIASSIGGGASIPSAAAIASSRDALRLNFVGDTRRSGRRSIKRRR